MLGQYNPATVTRGKVTHKVIINKVCGYNHNKQSSTNKYTIRDGQSQPSHLQQAQLMSCRHVSPSRPPSRHVMPAGLRRHAAHLLPFRHLCPLLHAYVYIMAYAEPAIWAVSGYTFIRRERRCCHCYRCHCFAVDTYRDERRGTERSG